MRKWGDRYDAKRVRDIDGMHFYMAYLMPKRTDAEVYINENKVHCRRSSEDVLDSC